MEMESLSLIDVAAEDDLLIPEVAQSAELPKLSFYLEPPNALGWENPVKMSKQMEQTPEMSDSPELKRAKSGKINLRKSLAWDSAFFTSEGVLENEELAIVNSTFRKTEGCRLTRIQEDSRNSSESNSTLDSDSYALENIEAGLFDNLRSSIQMSLGNCGKTSNVVSDVQRSGSVKKVGLLSKMKPPVNPIKYDATKQLKQQNLEAASGVKLMKVANGSVQSKSSRPPRIMLKPMPTVTSSPTSSGSVELKSNPKNISSGTGVHRHSGLSSDKMSGSSHILSTIPNSTAKASPRSRSGTIVFSTSSSYSGSSTSVGKSPSEISRKRSALRNSNQSSYGSTTTTRPSRLAPPKLRFSSSVSPLSSIDSMVSGSSSSASNAIKPSSSVGSFGAGQLKPSELRMPTPKAGYFDAEKTDVRSSNKISQSILKRSLVKSTCGTRNIAGDSKQKPTKMSIPVSPAAQSFESPRTLSTTKSPNNNTKRASPVTLSKRKESAELRGVFTSSRVVATSKSRTGTTYQISKELNHEQEKSQSSLDSQYEHMENSVAHKSEKENLHPLYEVNSVAQHLPSGSKTMSMIETMSQKIYSLSLSGTNDTCVQN